MQRSTLTFTAPRQVAVRQEPLPDPGPGQVLVAAQASAISSGTELLIYRGQFPQEMVLDESIPALSGAFAYPLTYGYASVGRVLDAGPGVDAAWAGRRVFAFHPHTSHFLAEPGDLMRLPDDLSPEAALFLPNMETAVNFLHDGAPLLGENALVLGQGVVGLLTTALLAQMPLAAMVTIDFLESRRQMAQRMAESFAGVFTSISPKQLDRARALLPGGADLIFELSGSPAALDTAIELAGFSGRVVIGSWYGDKRANLTLGGRFHRSRLRLISSQVTTIDPALSGRWTKARRFETAWEMIRRLQPEQLITHRFPLEAAPEAYHLLDEHPQTAIQVIFTHPSTENA